MAVTDQEIVLARSRSDLAALLGPHVRLTETADGLVGDCPWCRDRGALMVKPDLEDGLFHRFSCAASGDAIAFLLLMDPSLTFEDAVRVLLSAAG